MAGAIDYILPRGTDAAGVGEDSGRERHASDQDIVNVEARVERRNSEERAA